MNDTESIFYDKRSARRVSGDRLPRQLQTLKVSFGAGGGTFRVQTIDASVSGISFKIELPTNSIPDYNLTITTADDGITLRDELVYAKPLDRETSRVSVHFTEQPGLEEYTDLVDRTGQ